MSLPRSFFDEVNREYLVLPDAIRITELKIESGDQNSQFTFIVTLDTDPSSLQQFDTARPIVLQGLQFLVEEPEDHRVISFDAAKQSANQFAVVITCDLASQDDILARITTDSTFLSPEYRANTEEFSSLVRIASAELSKEDIRKISIPPDNDDYGNMAQFALRLHHHVAQSPFANHKESELTNLIFAHHVDVAKDTISLHGNAMWKAQFLTSNDLEVALSEVQEKVEYIIATSKYLHVLFEE